MTEHEDGTLTAEFEGNSAPDEIIYNGKTYSRTGEVTIGRADGAPKEPESVVVEYSGLEEQQEMCIRDSDMASFQKFNLPELSAFLPGLLCAAAGMAVGAAVRAAKRKRAKR